ncbi:28 kDa heat- and acid-stable phosphoprotein-like isoform X2 [Ostrea edulis]|uniref:28 kDa heat- and acid-stable phosphoprotein-like isoform X2 n=1 Tax=Ostrea edulis TaxID=37623 RepID=UPI00209574C4|nr:28 kDa heat- and acid-stable phosphoprotein-like isoform X2 [Ostrea edulis]
MPRGGRKGGGYGPKKNYKGQRRHFTDAEELKQQIERDKKQQNWRRQQGLESDEEEEDGATAPKTGAPGELPPSGSESSSEEDSDDEDKKAKGVEHLIEIENPNRSGGRQLKKVTELDTKGKTQLSRREREELEKQQAKARYQQLHMEGKTEEARADLARLAIIRKQREEAAKKRDEERKAAEEAKTNKS